MRKKRDQQNLGRALGFQVFDGRFDRGILVAHGEFDGHIDALLQKSLGMAARDDERRAFGRPNGRVGVAGFLRAADQDDSNNEPAENPRHIDNAAIHQKFVEVAAHIRDGRRIGGAQIDQKDCLAHRA